MWRTGLVAPQHVASSQTRAQTRVPCIGRRILNHCATREAPELFSKAVVPVYTPVSSEGEFLSAFTLALGIVRLLNFNLVVHSGIYLH